MIMWVWREIVQTDTHHIAQVADWHQWNKQDSGPGRLLQTTITASASSSFLFYSSAPPLFLITGQASTPMKLLTHNFKNTCTSFTQQCITYSILCSRAIICIAHFLLCFIFQNISVCNSSGCPKTFFVD